MDPLLSLDAHSRSPAQPGESKVPPACRLAPQLLIRNIDRDGLKHYVRTPDAQVLYLRPRRPKEIPASETATLGLSGSQANKLS